MPCSWASGGTSDVAAKALTDAGLAVMALDGGPAYDQDDVAARRLRNRRTCSVHGALATPGDRVMLTFRDNRDQTKPPMRRIGSFTPPKGSGGSGTTWSGHSPRADPFGLVLRAHSTKRHGAEVFSKNMTSQNWGVDCVLVKIVRDHFEKVAAVSGTAGDVREDGNPYKGERSDDFPPTAFKRNCPGRLFTGPFDPGAGPTAYHPTAPGRPPWGAGWTEAVVAGYQNRVWINVHASMQSSRGNDLDLPRRPRPTAAQDDLRLYRQRAAHDGLRDGARRGDRARDGRGAGAGERAAGARRYHTLSDDT